MPTWTTLPSNKTNVNPVTSATTQGAAADFNTTFAAIVELRNYFGAMWNDLVFLAGANRVLKVAKAAAAAAGNALTIAAGDGGDYSGGTDGQAGADLVLKAGQGGQGNGTTRADGAGGAVRVSGGDAGSATGNGEDGGSVYLDGGTESGGGDDGSVFLCANRGAGVQVGPPGGRVSGNLLSINGDFSTSGSMSGTEISDGSVTPQINQGAIYFRDNGSGKTQLVVKFNTGAVQVIATQP